MKDQYNRQIDYLRISITDLCNLRCVYCMPEDGVIKRDCNEILNGAEIINAARAAASLGITKIRITGGEPLVKRGITGICKSIADIPGIEEVCITTNGTLLEKFAVGLKDAGVSRVNVSLDTLNPEKFRQITRIGNIEDVFRGLEALKAAGFERTKINTVLMAGFNEDEIEDFIRFANEHSLEQRFIELMPMGAIDEASSYLSSQSVIDILQGYQCIGNDGVSEMYVSETGSKIGFIRTISCKFCDKCNKIRLTADGHLKPCLHMEDGPYIKGCTYEEMVDIMKAAIYNKPDTRGALDNDNISASGRSMSQIGG